MKILIPLDFNEKHLVIKYLLLFIMLMNFIRVKTITKFILKHFAMQNYFHSRSVSN